MEKADGRQWQLYIRAWYQVSGMGLTDGKARALLEINTHVRTDQLIQSISNNYIYHSQVWYQLIYIQSQY